MTSTARRAEACGGKTGERCRSTERGVEARCGIENNPQDADQLPRFRKDQGTAGGFWEGVRLAFSPQGNRTGEAGDQRVGCRVTHPAASATSSSSSAVVPLPEDGQGSGCSRAPQL